MTVKREKFIFILQPSHFWATIVLQSPFMAVVLAMHKGKQNVVVGTSSQRLEILGTTRLADRRSLCKPGDKKIITSKPKFLSTSIPTTNKERITSKERKKGPPTSPPRMTDLRPLRPLTDEEAEEGDELAPVVEWTDACIRWTEDDLEPHMRPSWSNKNKDKKKTNYQGSNEHDNDNDNSNSNQASTEEEEEEGGFLDPFADPNPGQEFTFEYSTGNVLEEEENEEDTTTTTTKTTPLTKSVDTVHVTVRGFKADSDETWESTGLTLWKATHSLNDYIQKHYHKWQGYSILELGAGLGVCGILTAKLITAHQLSSLSSPSSSTATATGVPTTSICLTDGDTQALALLRENVKRNGCTRSTTTTATTTTTVRQLLWGRENAQQFATTPASAACAKGPPLSYEIILASDVIYAPQVLVPLWETIQVLLAQGGTFILAFAKRKVPVQVQDVLRTAKEYGFDYSSTTLPPHLINRAHHNSEAEQHDDVFLYEFHRQST
jgi:predicted nicotinamide N-methyase